MDLKKKKKAQHGKTFYQLKPTYYYSPSLAYGHTSLKNMLFPQLEILSLMIG
jgi:hypothetical protein